MKKSQVWDHLYLFKRQNSFLTHQKSWMWLHPVYFETPMKKYGCGHTHDVQQEVFTIKNKDGCMDTQEVLHVSCKVTYGKGY